LFHCYSNPIVKHHMLSTFFCKSRPLAVPFFCLRLWVIKLSPPCLKLQFPGYNVSKHHASWRAVLPLCAIVKK